MYLNDHVPPHFHAFYGEFSATVLIDSGEIMEGKLPKTAANLVNEWAGLNRAALLTDWDLARQNIAPLPIGGLDAQ